MKPDAPPSFSDFTTKAAPPPRWLYATELVRGASELLFYYFSSPFLSYQTRHLKGKKAVLVLPGLANGDFSTRILRRFLRKKGYRTYAWRLGFNLGRYKEYEPLLLERLRYVYEKEKQPVTLIGWSLGGIYARVLAHQQPQMVESVITLASPFLGTKAHSHASRMYEFLSRQKQGEVDENLRRLAETPPPVPSICFYSPIDGIVSPLHCFQAETHNIEVVASHVGMGHHPATLWALADRLALLEKEPEKVTEKAPIEPPFPWRFFIQKKDK
ncbi:alpha/beta hydrolase [Hugenholtzia roseola]|uniref:PGAP1-like alpha/beta domain-containing protein n=1 Tax=Hugenholtzia roseola TaxID=1002 RepID=UPI000414BC52|nr:alpha/beta hydrolase [Hugenholtzia roseola]